MEIIGHERIRDMLRGIATLEELPHHAFFFFGPDGVGKSLVAAEFASRILGYGGDDPREKQDILRIVPEEKKDGKRKKIPVEAIRDAGVFLSRFPAEARARVVLIEDAQELSESAQNALLKIFEEPNKTSVIILVASRRGRIRDTIVSRAFRVPFLTVPEADMRIGATRLFPKADVASLEPFFFSLGCSGLVVGALSDPTAFATRRETLRTLFRISSLSLAERLSLSERLSGSVPETVRLLGWWLVGLRSMKLGERDPKTLSSLYRFFDDLEEGIRLLRDTNANARLVIDRIFLSL